MKYRVMIAYATEVEKELNELNSKGKIETLLMSGYSDNRLAIIVGYKEIVCTCYAPNWDKEHCPLHRI